ncbi:MAG: hypothetical protein J6M39_06765 [Lachnospiraceae bacterium]|nr:hypothetical protein [Lachnospiraceae bacterium]
MTYLLFSLLLIVAVVVTYFVTKKASYKKGWDKSWDTAWNKGYEHGELVGKQSVKANAIEITEDTSDGYHTFKELYYYRLCYNATLINSLVQIKKDNPVRFKDIKVCKSKKHFGGEHCYDGTWFIVMISTPWGQISNHYKLEYWDMFNCPVAKTSWKWDGHGMQEAMERLNRLSKFIATGSSL